MSVISFITGTHVKTVFIENALNYSKVFTEILNELAKNEKSYALRLELTLKDDKKVMFWISKDNKIVLASVNGVSFKNILNYENIGKYLPLIIDVYVLSYENLLKDMETLNFAQKLSSFNIDVLTPDETKKYVEEFLSRIRAEEKLKEKLALEYKLSNELSKVLKDVLVLSRIILYVNKTCSGKIRVNVSRKNSFRELFNKVIKELHIQTFNKVSKDFIIYVYSKVKVFSIRMILDLEECCYGVLLTANGKTLEIDEEMLAKPIGKLFPQKEATIVLTFKCVPKSILKT